MDTEACSRLEPKAAREPEAPVNLAPGSFVIQPLQITGGGIIPDDDMKKLNEMGVGKLFAPGTPTSEIASYISNWVKENRTF